LNKLESSRFFRNACLDRIFRNSPQPEALYVDADSVERLVIERETLVWPTAYVIRHKNDHFVAELLIEGLQDLMSGALIWADLPIRLSWRFGSAFPKRNAAG
jgi:hypothetical protein